MANETTRQVPYEPLLSSLRESSVVLRRDQDREMIIQRAAVLKHSWCRISLHRKGSISETHWGVSITEVITS